VLHPFPDLPLAPRLAAVADEARQAGVQGTVGFNYRNAPAVAAARELAAHGVDLVWHLLGEVDSVVADTAIFLPERARHGAYAAFQPGSDLAMGFDDLKVIEAHNFLRSIAEGTPHGTTLADAVRSAATLDAMARSAETGTWVEVADT
jgi:predicted dehydrogenase